MARAGADAPPRRRRASASGAGGDDTACLRDGGGELQAQWDTLPDLVAVVDSGRPRRRKGAAAPLPQHDSRQQQQQQSVAPAADAESAAAEMAAGAPKRQPYRIGLTKEEAPAHVTYPYVMTGYRAGGTYARCAAAALELHAETFNAWTMVWGSMLSLYLFAAALRSLSAAGALGGGGWWAAGRGGSGFWGGAPDWVPFALLTGSTLAHAPWSVAFHLFRCMSPEVYNLWRRLDQVFIFQVSQFLTLGIAWFVYEARGPLLANMAAAVLTAQVATRDIWGLPADFQRNRAHMVGFIACIVACYFWPMGWQAARDAAAWRAWAAAGAAGGAAAAPPLAAAGYAAGTLLSLGAGAAVFATGFPERCFPRTFDVFGFSHQLMHWAAISAHAFEFAFVLEMWSRRRAEALGAVA
ncbi:MAG: hypothetical protein J3K34DRAFT_519501 [Monoraphidium minutum]|nr:MAG: hypothetical protein J3K34DRAFT_519501 [Monoraphidium minutum]